MVRGLKSRRVLALAAFLASVAGRVCAGQSYTRASSPTEYQVKAAYLLNFTKFIEWPPTALGDADAQFAICIAGHDPFGGVLDQVVEGETVDGRKIVVRRLGDQRPAGCHVLYGAKPQQGPGQAGVLTVGEGEPFTRTGGIIGFVIDSRRVRFDINQRAAQRAGLTLSSKLLSVARTVEK